MNTPHLILIRGLPGSGKSTLAKALATSLSAKHFENDDFFTDAQGDYLYQPDLIKQAVLWCLERTQTALTNGETVIVSNTFTQEWEMTAYFQLAATHNATLQIIETWGPWKDTHSVPHEKLIEMRNRFCPTQRIWERRFSK